MNNNINSLLDGLLVKRRSKCAVDHGDGTIFFAKLSNLLKIYQGHGWITRGFTKDNLTK